MLHDHRGQMIDARHPIGRPGAAGMSRDTTSLHYEEILNKDGNTINGLAVNAAKEMRKEVMSHFEKI